MAGLQDLPSVHEMLESERGVALSGLHGRPLVLFAVQRALEAERAAQRPCEAASRWASVEAEIDEVRRVRLRPVINATGVILHTNLGRAPLARQAATMAAHWAVEGTPARPAAAAAPVPAAASAPRATPRWWRCQSVRPRSRSDMLP